MVTPPTAEQLDALLGTADRRRLTTDEAALLRAGVRQLRASLAGAGAAVRRAPSGAYVAQLQRQAARADRHRTAWLSARRRARRVDVDTTRWCLREELEQVEERHVASVVAVRALADELEAEEAYGGYADANSEAARRIRTILDGAVTPSLAVIMGAGDQQTEPCDTHVWEDEGGWHASCSTCGEHESDVGSEHDADAWVERHTEARP